MTLPIAHAVILRVTDPGTTPKLRGYLSCKGQESDPTPTNCPDIP